MFVLKNKFTAKAQIVKTYSNLKRFSTAAQSASVTLKDYLTKRDHMISGFFKDGSARFVFSDCSQTLKEAQKRFEIYDYKKLEELGIAFNTSLVLNSFLNGEERVKLLCQYCQEINEDKSFMTTIYSESIGTGEVRGFYEESKVNSDAMNKDLPPFLKISKILYKQTSEVFGIIKLTNHNKLTEDDIFKYFEESEQIRTHVYFNNKFDNDNFISQCFILQKMPDCDLIELENKFIKIINNKHFKEIKREGLKYSTFSQIFKDLKSEVEVRRTPIQFFCRCSKSQFKNVLVHMARSDIKDMMIKEQNSITCKNCNTEYFLTQEDFEEILKHIPK